MCKLCECLPLQPKTYLIRGLELRLESPDGLLHGGELCLPLPGLPPQPLHLHHHRTVQLDQLTKGGGGTSECVYMQESGCVCVCVGRGGERLTLCGLSSP